MRSRSFVSAALVVSGLALAVGVSLPSRAEPPKLAPFKAVQPPIQGPAVDALRMAQDPNPVYRLRGDKNFFYRGEFQIDADGAPKAYHPGVTCDASYKTHWKLPAMLD